MPAAAPTSIEFARDIVRYFLVGDVVSYFWHRFEHSNRRYMRSVHDYHHLDTPPLTFAVGAFSVTAVNMIMHCGYRLPVHDWIFATSREHDIHHASREPRNISVMLSICDRIFGTFEKAR